MKVVVDEGRYDDFQMAVGSAITHEIYTAMKRAGVADGERLERIVADALFHIGCVIDTSHAIESPHGTMRAILAFAKDEDKTTLISAAGGSWIHEYAFGIAEEYFDKLKPSRKADIPPAPPYAAPLPQRDEEHPNLIGRVVRWFTN